MSRECVAISTISAVVHLCREYVAISTVCDVGHVCREYVVSDVWRGSCVS